MQYIWHLQNFWNLQWLPMSAASPRPVQTLRQGRLNKHFTSERLPRMNQSARTTVVNSILQFHWWYLHTATGVHRSLQLHETHSRQLSSNGLHHFESENPETCIQLWHVIVHGFCCLSVVSQPGVLKSPCGPSTLMFSPLFFNSSWCIIFSYFILYDRIMYHISYVLTEISIHIFLHWFLPFLLLHPRYNKSCFWCDDRRCCCCHRQGLRPTHGRAAGLGGSTEGHRIGGQVLPQKGQTPVLRRKEVLELWRFSFWSCVFFCFFLASFFPRIRHKANIRKKKDTEMYKHKPTTTNRKLPHVTRYWQCLSQHYV